MFQNDQTLLNENDAHTTEINSPTQYLLETNSAMFNDEVKRFAHHAFGSVLFRFYSLSKSFHGKSVMIFNMF